MRIGCVVDRLDRSLVEGWILDRDQPDRRLAVDILLGDPPHERALGCCVAADFRADLLEAGLGDGACAFRFEMPPLPPHLLGLVRLRLSGSDLFLRPPRPPPGLWTDRHDWLETLGRRYREGMLTAPVPEALFRFQRDGWLALPGLLRGLALRTLRAGLAGLWRRPPPGLRAETFEPDGHLRALAPTRAMQSGRAMLVDPHRRLPACRAPLDAAPAAALLEALLDAPPAISNSRAGRLPPGLPACEGGLSPGPVAPEQLACLLALEDIDGGLVLLEGSHRAPPPFGPSNTMTETMEWATERQDEYLARIEADAEALGHRHAAPRLRAGDLLLLHPRLARGTAGNDGPLPALLSLHLVGRDPAAA